MAKIAVYCLQNNEEIYKGTCKDLEFYGFEPDRVRTAIKTDTKYMGYTCSVIDYTNKHSIIEKPKIKTQKLDDTITQLQGKTYAEMQLEETLRMIGCRKYA